MNIASHCYNEIVSYVSHDKIGVHRNNTNKRGLYADNSEWIWNKRY